MNAEKGKQKENNKQQDVENVSKLSNLGEKYRETKKDGMRRENSWLSDQTDRLEN